MKPRHSQANLRGGSVHASFTMQPAMGRAVLSATLAMLSLANSQAQTTGTWNLTPTTGLTWNTAANWTGLTGGLVPNAIDAAPNFTSNITVAKTITLDGDKTVGTLGIDDSGTSFFGFTLNPGTPATSALIFDVASGSAAITSETATNTATNTIGAPITLMDPLVITNTKTNVNGTLNLNGVITDGAASLGITKLGNGIAQLAGANTYDGGTIITAGRLGAGNATSYGTGSVTVDSGGQAWLSSGATFANNFSLAGNGYANTLDGGALNGAIRFGGATTTGTIHIAADARIGGYSGGSGTLAGPLTGSALLEINQPGTLHNGNLILTGSAAGYTGTITVSQGTFRLGTASNLGGSLVVKDGVNLYVENIGTPGAATVGTDSGATRSLTLGNPGSTNTGPNLFIDPSTGDALQVNGDVNLNGTTTVTLAGVVASNPVTILTYSGTLTGSASNLTLPGGMAGYRPGTQFTTSGGQIKLDLVQSDLKWTGAASSNWNTADLNWLDGANPATFFNVDAVTFDETTAPKAAFTTNLANATNNDLVFTAVASGAAGESVEIEYEDPFTPNTALSVSVSGTTISVSLGTDAAGLITSTAAAIKAAVEANAPASALATVTMAAGNDGSGLVLPFSATALAMTNPAITIASGVTVSPGDMTFNHSAIDYSVTGTGAIGGGGGLTKIGTGMLTISTPNTFAGGVTVSAGRLRVGNNSALGTGALTMSGGQLSSDSTTARSLANAQVLSGSLTLGDATNTGAITLNGAGSLAGNTTIDVPTANTIAHALGGPITDGAGSFSLTKRGSTGVLALSGANSYDGGTLIEEGRINATNAASFGTGPVTVYDSGQAYLAVTGTITNAFTLSGIGFSETAGNLGTIRLQGATVSGPITLVADTRITAHGSTGTLSGAIGETGGQYALELSNYNTTTDSTITVSGNNTYSLGTTVKGAIVIANHNNAFGSGDVTIRSNGTVARISRVQLGANIELPAANGFMLDSDAATGVSAITSFAGDNITASTAIVNGPVEILKKVGGGGHFASTKGSASVLRVMGPVTSPNGVSVVIRQGTVELGGGGDYAAIEVTDGKLKLANHNGLCTTSILTIGTSGTAGDTGTFDLNGFNQSLAGVLAGARPASVTNNGAGAATLTLDIAAASTYAGTFVDGASALNLSKTGAGTLTLSGTSSSFTGGLSVTGGGLDLTGTLGTAGATATLGSGTTLSGEGTFGGSLSLSGATVNVNGTTPLSVFASENLNSTGGVTVNLQSLPTTPGAIEIIAFGGTLTGNAGNFTLAGASNYHTPVFSAAANAVKLTLGAPVDLTWTGTGGSNWDVNTTSNWNNPALVPSPFYYADNVTFGNTGGGTIGVPANVNAANLVINSNDHWLFQGTGIIAAASVTKDGSGSATFETPVNFSGPITLTAGILKLSPPTGMTDTLPGAITGAGSLVKGGDGILSLASANPGFTGAVAISKGELIITNSAALGTGALTFGDASTAPTDVAKLTLNSGVTVTGKTITVAPECLSAAVSSLGGTLATSTILKRGPGALRIGDASNQLATTNYLTGTSSITVEGGVVGFSSITATTSSTSITLGTTNSGDFETVLNVPVAASADQVVLSTPVSLGTLAAGSTSKAILRYSGSSASVGSSNFNGPVALNGRDLYIENVSDITPGSIIRLWAAAGAISGTGNVHIRDGVTATGDYNAGPRTRLTGTNTWVGDLYVETGMVQIGNGSAGSALNAIPNTAVVYVSAGTRTGIGGGSETFAGIVGGAAVGTAGAALLNPNTGGSGTSTVTLSGTGTYVYDGTMSDEAGHIFALVKSTGGTQTVNGACSFTGATTITGGKLILNNSHVSPITVASGATLGGTMTSTNGITATSATLASAKIAPGNSTGTMTAASATMNTGTLLEMEIDDASAPKNDKLVITGALTLGGAALNLAVTGTAAAPVYVIATYGSLTGTFGTITGKPSNYDLVYDYNDGVSTNNIALVQQGDAYQGWLATYPALTGANRAPGVDFDNDGLDNGIEFVIGSDPTQATGSTTSGYPAATVTGGNLVFTFKRSTASKAYPVSVETSADLATWPPANAYLVPTADTAGPPVAVSGETVTVTIPMAPDARKFARLKAEIPFTP